MSSPTKGQWMKPGDVMQKLKAKKRALKARINKGIRQQALEISHNNGAPQDTTNKRINPFRCVSDGSDTKRPRLEVATPQPEPSFDQTLFEILRSGAADVRTAARPQPAPASFAGLLATDGVGRASESTAEQVDESPKGVPDLPTDWGLKTKIRFLSKTPFPWTSRLKTLEEASAVTSCVRCLPPDQPTLDTSPNALLHRHALYWQHPWLPWLSLFPRLHSRASGPRSLFTEPQMETMLRTEWGESLRSLFQLLRSRQCPFFYVCAATFCCLFRAAGVGGVTDTHALLTPTTHGLRELLKRDDVEFTLPLRPARPPNPSSESPPVVAQQPAAAADHSSGDENEDEDEDEDPEHWLQRMGIEAAAMPGLQSTRRKLQQERRHDNDGTASSTALVQGGDVYALLNFLLNSRACVAATGPLAGVPPTLLAPTAFQGGSLQPLKVRHGTVQQGRETFHSFELAGPVMPHAVVSLVALVRRFHADFTVTLSSVRATDALSQLRPPGALSAPAVFGQQGLTDCGLDAPLVARLCHPEPATLRDVTCADRLYRW